MGELTDVMKTENEATHTRPGDSAKAPIPATFSMLCTGSALTGTNATYSSSPNLGTQQGIKVFSYESSETQEGGEWGGWW